MSVSEKKILANRRNSMRSTGPKSAAGKRNSARNALKHGIFASELMLRDEELPIFDALRTALRHQFAPSTAMQEVAFDAVTCLHWRVKLTLRREKEGLKERLDPDQGGESGDGAAAGPPSQWYGLGGHELQTAKRFLTELAEDLAANGFCHMEDQRERIIRAYGQQFYDSLMEWEPMANIDDVRLAAMLSAKDKMYGMQLPPPLEEAMQKEQIVVDPRLSLQMAVKLVEERRQHLEDLSRISRLKAYGFNEREGAATFDLGARYLTTAIRDLQGAVRWFLELKAQGL